MATTVQQQHHAQGQGVTGWTVGLSVFAGAMMLLSGAFAAFEGLAALFNGNFFVVGQQYAFTFDTATWGWVHLIMGVIVAFAGIAVFSGRAWGRTMGIILAVLSAVANFFFIPYYPVWAMLIIALDVAVIGALAAYTPEAAGADYHTT